MIVFRKIQKFYTPLDRHLSTDTIKPPVVIILVHVVIKGSPAVDIDFQPRLSRKMYLVGQIDILQPGPVIPYQEDPRQITGWVHLHAIMEKDIEPYRKILVPYPVYP